MYKTVTRTIKNIPYFYRATISWSKVSTGNIAFRYYPNGFIFDVAGCCIYSEKIDLLSLLSLVNSKVAKYYLQVLSPTINYEAGHVNCIPIRKEYLDDQIAKIGRNNVDYSKQDWDSYETSWDFKCHPLIQIGLKHRRHNDGGMTIEDCFYTWTEECDNRFNQLKKNEEKLNRIFIKIYRLQDDLTPDVDDKEVTVRRADLLRDIKSLLSYAVGCMFGRYSLDSTGLAFGGGVWDDRKYSQFKPDVDNIIPISDEEYLEDDIISRLCKFLKVALGEDTLEENLDYIAKALSNKGNSSREVIRNYFLYDFFKDHCQTYSVSGSGKRPIYWLFDSGKQNGFKALIYLHRYNADTIGNLRIDYLHRMQRIYESEIIRMQDMIEHNTNVREIAQATKRREKLAKQLKECREYDEKLAHLALSRIELDLDDGVKTNYRKLQTASDGKYYEVLADSKNIMAKV